MKSRFETGLRNFLRRQDGDAEGPSLVAPGLPASPAGPASPSPWRARAKKLLRPVLPLFLATRRFMNAPLSDRLWELEARQSALQRTEAERIRDQITQSATQQMGQLESRMAQLDSRLSLLGDHADRLNSQLSLVGDRLTSIERYHSAFGGRFDEIEVKIRPVLDFGDAQAVRLGDGYILAPKDEPYFILMLADATTGGLEPGTRKCIQRLLQPGMRAVDVGANIGLLTLACARAVGAEGKVYAFEPEDRIADLLKRTLALNGLSWVELRREAAGEREEEKQFHVSSITGHSSLYQLPEEEARSVQTIQVVRLDDVLKHEKRVDLVKLDVEGAEIDVLKGMKKVIKKNDDLAIIAEFGPSHLTRVGISADGWFSAFEKHGFKAYAISEPFGQCVATSAEELMGIASTNVAFVRPGQSAERRLLGEAVQ